MGRQYLHISSRDRKIHERTSEMRIELSAPIHHATEVKMVSFSTANEIYNVVNGINSVMFNFYPIVGGVIAEVAVAYTISIPVGIYTVADLVSSLNSAVSATILPLDVTNVLFEISPETKRVMLTIQSDSIMLATVLFPNVDTFYTSILHRLGFSRAQICSQIEAFGSNPSDTGTILARNLYGDLGPLNMAPYAIWNCASASLEQTTKQAENQGFETAPMLYLHSRALVTDTIKTHHNPDGSTGTASCNVLAKVPINVSTYSWIHLTGAETQFAHELSGRTINSFDIYLTDHLHQIYPNDHMKDWDAVLEFTFENDDSDINASAVRALNKLGFDRRHGCV